VSCGEHAFCKADGHEAYCICEDGWTFNPNDIAAGCVGKRFSERIKIRDNCTKAFVLQINFNFIFFIQISMNAMR